MAMGDNDIGGGKRVAELPSPEGFDRGKELMKMCWKDAEEMCRKADKRIPYSNAGWIIAQAILAKELFWYRVQFESPTPKKPKTL